MGAFEAPTVATCKNTPSLCPVVTPEDKVAPKISKVKFKAAKGKRKTHSLKLTLSEAAKVKATRVDSSAVTRARQAQPYRRVRRWVMGKSSEWVIAVIARR